MGMVAAVELEMRLTREHGRSAVLDRYRRSWSRQVLWLLGVRIATEGSAPGRAARGRLVVANHRSPLDVLVLMSLFGGRFLSRGDVEGWPLVGAGARYIGTIFVDRSRRESGAAAIRAIRRSLSSGETVVVFPEGTTFRGDEVRPFLPGAFAAGKGLDIDIVPVGLAYPKGLEFVGESFVSWATRTTGARRTPIGVAVGTPHAMGPDTKRTAVEMHEEVQRLTGRARGIAI